MHKAHGTLDWSWCLRSVVSVSLDHVERSERKMKILLLLAALSAVCLAAGDYVGVLVRTGRNAALQDGSRQRISAHS